MVQMLDNDVLGLHWGGDPHRVEVRGGNYWHYDPRDPLHQLIDSITGDVSNLMNGAEIPIFSWYPEYPAFVHLLRNQVVEAKAIYFDPEDGMPTTIDAPNFLYHATDAKHLPSILKLGLIANGPNGDQINFPRMEMESLGRIFLTGTPAGAQHYFDRSIVLQVDASMVPELRFYADFSPGGEYVTPGPIPQAAIRVTQAQ